MLSGWCWDETALVVCPFRIVLRGRGEGKGPTFIFGSFEVGGIKWYVYLFFSYTEPVCDSLDIFGLIRIVWVGWVWSE